jgi:MtN3 and saliva related transmembrane protein
MMNSGADMGRHGKLTLVLLSISLIALCGCDDLVPQDSASLFVPRLQRSEIIGFLAGFGTTFAAVPDLVSMLRRRSSAGMNPRMAAIMGVFQILWVYYGLLIASRPVIAWNLIAVWTNFFSVSAYLYFVRKEGKDIREDSDKI